LLRRGRKGREAAGKIRLGSLHCRGGPLTIPRRKRERDKYKKKHKKKNSDRKAPEMSKMDRCQKAMKGAPIGAVINHTERVESDGDSKFKITRQKRMLGEEEREAQVPPGIQLNGLENKKSHKEFWNSYVIPDRLRYEVKGGEVVRKRVQDSYHHKYFRISGVGSKVRKRKGTNSRGIGPWEKGRDREIRSLGISFETSYCVQRRGEGGGAPENRFDRRPSCDVTPKGKKSPVVGTGLKSASKKSQRGGEDY